MRRSLAQRRGPDPVTGGSGPWPATAGFEELAAGYDADFTQSFLGSLLRDAVWRRLDANFVAGDHVIDLGCGTGEDAVHLARRAVHVLAIDAAPAMVEEARRKVESAGLGHRVRVQRLAMEELAAEALGGAPPFDGAFSDFGALNCVTDLARVAGRLAAFLRPGARAVLVVMGPAVPWEWAWFLSRREPGKAFRRLRREGVAWRGMRVRYPAPGTVRRAFGPEFRRRRVSALGALLPPTYAEAWAARRRHLVNALARWERRLEALPPLPSLADHYILELERR